MLQEYELYEIDLANPTNFDSPLAPPHPQLHGSDWNPFLEYHEPLHPVPLYEPSTPEEELSLSPLQNLRVSPLESLVDDLGHIADSLSESSDIDLADLNLDPQQYRVLSLKKYNLRMRKIVAEYILLECVDLCTKSIQAFTQISESLDTTERVINGVIDQTSSQSFRQIVDMLEQECSMEVRRSNPDLHEVVEDILMSQHSYRNQDLFIRERKAVLMQVLGT